MENPHEREQAVLLERIIKNVVGIIVIFLRCSWSCRTSAMKLSSKWTTVSRWQPWFSLETSYWPVGASPIVHAHGDRCQVIRQLFCKCAIQSDPTRSDAGSKVDVHSWLDAIVEKGCIRLAPCIVWFLAYETPLKYPLSTETWSKCQSALRPSDCGQRRSKHHESSIDSHEYEGVFIMNLDTFSIYEDPPACTRTRSDRLESCRRQSRFRE